MLPITGMNLKCVMIFKRRDLDLFFDYSKPQDAYLDLSHVIALVKGQLIVYKCYDEIFPGLIGKFFKSRHHRTATSCHIKNPLS